MRYRRSIGHIGLGMKQTTTISVNEQVMQSVDKRARCCGMSRSSYIELVLVRDTGGELRLTKEIGLLSRRLAFLAFSLDGAKAKR